MWQSRENFNSDNGAIALHGSWSAQTHINNGVVKRRNAKALSGRG